MPLFDYTGQLQNGAAFDGTLNAESHERAEAILAEMGLRVISLRAANRRAFVAPLSIDDMLFLNDNIAAMTRGGLPLDEGLRKLAAETGSSRLKRLLLDVAEDLSRGQPLEQSIARHAARFPTDYAGVVAAGLRTGDLGGSLHALGTHLRLRSDIRRMLWEVAAYPLTVVIFAMIFLSLFMRFLAPSLAELRDEIIGFRRDMGVVPSNAEAVFHGPFFFHLAAQWSRVEIGILAIAGLLIATTLVLQLPALRGAREAVLRALPGVSRIYRASVLARFAHVCALAARSGTPLPELLLAGASASGSLRLSAAAKRVGDRLLQGASLQDASYREQEIPALFCSIVNSSGSAGELPASLQELAALYEQRARQRTAALRVVLGPILFLFLAATVGAVISGVMLAIVNLLNILTSLT
ncbi:MAG: type II secretion system F family protein [Phycisphaerales bacterium]|nr:type II secretion system F family protein [Phycisphaerales bacterium]